MTDITSLIGGYGVQLESKAQNAFGAAVGDYASQAGLGPLSQIAQSSISNGGLTVTSLSGLASAFGVNSIDGLLGTGAGSWSSVRYADDLIKYAPKHRFIFKVKFVFNDPYSRINREFMYVVKEIDKPKVTFEYEDVNMYNFKTKVLKAIRHEPLTMSFHDDIQNKVLDFFNAYRVAYSPVSSLTYLQKSMFENSGMDFYPPGSNGTNSASMGLLENGNVNILSYVEVAQVYAHGTRQNKFIFTNPRIESFDFDNLSHESSEGNGLSVSFNYDALYVHDEATSGTPEYAWGQTDILGNGNSLAASQFGTLMGIGSSLSSLSAGGLSGITDALGNSLSAISSAFPSIAGNLKGITSSASGFLSSAEATVASATSSVSQGVAGLFSSSSGSQGPADSADFSAMDANIDI